jgi:hypothetical protein
MSTQGRRHYSVRHVPLIAAARLDCLVRTCAWRISCRTMCGLGLVAAALAAIAYLRGAELHPGFAAGQPPLLPPTTAVTDDGRA